MISRLPLTPNPAPHPADFTIPNGGLYGSQHTRITLHDIATKMGYELDELVIRVRRGRFPVHAFIYGGQWCVLRREWNAYLRRRIAEIDAYLTDERAAA